jgi:membrane-bound serine protease (ClpP class)
VLATVEALLALAILLGSVSSPAEAASTAPSDVGAVHVVAVSGLIDPVLANLIEGSIATAESGHAVALVLQLNSSGTVLSDADLTQLAQRMKASSVPVDVWVGPSGSKALGGAAELVGIADVAGVAPGVRVGDIGHQRLPVDEFGRVFGDHTSQLLHHSVSAERMVGMGLARSAPTVGDFIVNLPGVKTKRVTIGKETRLEPVTVVLFSRLPLADQLVHTVSSPAVAYLLLAIGLGLLVFEFFTAGIGIAGLVGAVCLVLSALGLWVLPTNWWAVGLMVFGFFGLAIDVQTGVPRAWTVIGLVCFTIASLTLYDGVSLSWIPLFVGVIGVVLAFTAGMPAMVRTRFSTPTIGREWMIGEEGTAVADLSPSGVVRIRDALWRAETNRATPIAAGEVVRVVGIDRLLLEVEPEEGGARDYRERR